MARKIDTSMRFFCPKREDAQAIADAELGRMVRALVKKHAVVMLGTTPQGFGVYANGAMKSEKRPTLDEAVRKALEAK